MVIGFEKCEDLPERLTREGSVESNAVLLISKKIAAIIHLVRQSIIGYGLFLH